jgi:sugar phosphate isomerase/epimerase
MKRRTFIKTNFTLTSGLLLFGQQACKSKNNLLQDIGLQLFSLPKMLNNDLRGSLEMISKMGYKKLELYGPYPFSSEKTIKEWKAITPQLGFSGSGFFNYNVSDFRSLLDEYGLKAKSAHIHLHTLNTRMPEVGDAARSLGLECVGIAYIPEEKRKTLDGYKRMADEFNVLGDLAKKEGLKFIYHNHGYGLKEQDDQVPMKLILDNTDPELVFFEMDIYWTTAGGANPIEYLKSYPNRYLCIHLKDMSKLVYFSKDGSNPQQWIELFPFMTNVGNGILDIKQIVYEAKKNGVKHFFVEQDMVENPKIALQASLDFLKNI